MTALRLELDARREEFEAHYSLAVALENQMVLSASFGELSLSVRHINTIKSGLIVHLYNIEEALLTAALSMLGSALGAVSPRRWNEHSLKEWLREAMVGRTSEGNEDGRLETVYSASSLLLSQELLGPQKLKKPSGTWDDKVIATFLKRSNISFAMPSEMWARISPTPQYGDKSPLQFLASRRNAVAHGTRSFEDGASDLDLRGIRVLAEAVLDYLGYVADAFELHVSSSAHLVS